MKDFAKLFHSDKLGQVLVTKDYDSKLNAYMIGVRFSMLSVNSEYTNEAERDDAFDSITIETIERSMFT